MKMCEAPGCTNYFEGRPNKKYCCRKCARRAEGVRYRNKYQEKIKPQARDRRAAARAARTQAASRTQIMELPAVHVPTKQEPEGPYISYGKMVAAEYLAQHDREMKERMARFYADLGKGESKREATGTE